MTDSLSARSSAGQLGRQRILDATMHCLCQEGYDATTIRRIAARLDCAIGSIYRYFADKHELLDAVTQRLLEPVNDALETGSTFAESVELYAQVAGAEAQAYRLMFWLTCNGTVPNDAPAEGVSNDRAASGQLPDVVARIVEAWAQQLGDPQLALRCWAMAHGAIIAGFEPAEVCRTVSGIARRGTSDHDDQAMAQIVTLLREPTRRSAVTAAAPAPDRAAPSAVAFVAPQQVAVAPVPIPEPMRPVVHDATPEPAAETTPLPPPPTAADALPEDDDADDVCLL